MTNDNSKDIIFLDPVFKEYIWGGSRLKTCFSYDIPSDTTAECWAIASHEHGSSVVSSGEYKGMKLCELYDKHPELFGSKRDKFPLLVKIIDADKDLSIQVHPDDKYASEHENGSPGKTECWYVLDCNENAELVIGHNAESKDELKSIITGGEWDKFIRRISIKKGDFIQINPGTVHAITAGVMILETHQNSDITYRIYDYDRLENGRKRTLHIENALDVITVPDTGSHNEIKNYSGLGENELKELINCEYYTVFKLNVNGEYRLIQDKDFMNVTVINGEGSVNGTDIKKGTSFILTHNLKEAVFNGKMELIISAP